LSELGAARLAAHLRACLECAAYASGLGEVARLLRSAPLEVPEIEIGLPPRRRVPGLQIAAVAAAAAVLVASSSFVLGHALGTGGSSTTTGAAVTGAADVLSVRSDSTQQHILAMFPRLHLGIAVRNGGAIAL